MIQMDRNSIFLLPAGIVIFCLVVEGIKMGDSEIQSAMVKQDIRFMGWKVRERFASLHSSLAYPVFWFVGSKKILLEPLQRTVVNLSLVLWRSCFPSFVINVSRHSTFDLLLSLLFNARTNS